MIPGSNLLRMALTVIAPTQNVAYRAYMGEHENSFGGTVPNYGTTTPLFGVSVQPITKEQIQQMGLAVNKRYVSVWTLTDVEAAWRGRQNDILLWSGSEWEVLPQEDWIIQDGWRVITAVAT